MSTNRPKTFSTGKDSFRASAVSGDSRSEAMSHSDSDDELEPGNEDKPASDVTIYNAYNMGPAFGKKFPLPYIRLLMTQVVKDKLANKTYNQSEALKWTRELADDINTKIKGRASSPRFKHVVNVMLYQQTGAGCFYGARAIWDELSDDYITFTFDGGSFVCIATVFGCYQY
ncbi:dynein light chain Tctex-type protein 2B [Drosophila santomea]|uniref:dynein light chain Tctex-type protein 2B n=1 Tax=Drosophila santomea TaxID=129105 RepID=UPI001CC9191A|nr:dynein light chain Tctex-type protein 2B [Drosophila santomea]